MGLMANLSTVAGKQLSMSNIQLFNNNYNNLTCVYSDTIFHYSEFCFLF